MRKLCLYIMTALLMCSCCCCNDRGGYAPFVGAWQYDVGNKHFVYEFSEYGEYRCTEYANGTIFVTKGKWRIDRVYSSSYNIRLYDLHNEYTELGNMLIKINVINYNKIDLLFVGIYDYFFQLKRI